MFKPSTNIPKKALRHKKPFQAAMTPVQNAALGKMKALTFRIRQMVD